MGLLTQQDPIGIAGGLNLYGYGNGDPVNFSDPFGLCPIPIACAAAIGGVVFGGVRIASNLLSDRPWTEGVAADVVRGIAIGGSFGLASPVVAGGAGTSAFDAVLFNGTRSAARTALGEGIEGVTSGQAANITRSIVGRGRVDNVTITQLSGGSVSVALERAGRDGSQVLTKVIDAAGRTTSMIQRAFNEAGNLTHFHRWLN